MIAIAGNERLDEDTVLRWRSRPARVDAWQNYVLVIEVDQVLRDMVRRALRAANHDVIAVRSDVEALRMIAAQAPSVIVLDLASLGVNGHTLLRALKAEARTRDIPVVVVTGTDIDHVKPDDCVCLLRAPVTVEQLTVAVAYASHATR